MSQPHDPRTGRQSPRLRTHMVGRCEGEVEVKASLGAAEDLIRNIHGVAPVAGLDGDEVGYLVGKVAEVKRQK